MKSFGLGQPDAEAGSSMLVPAPANASIAQTSIMTWMLSANAPLRMVVAALEHPIESNPDGWNCQ